MEVNVLTFTTVQIKTTGKLVQMNQTGLPQATEVSREAGCGQER